MFWRNNNCFSSAVVLWLEIYVIELPPFQYIYDVASREFVHFLSRFENGKIASFQIFQIKEIIENHTE